MAVQSSDGLVLATDSRETFGLDEPLMREKKQKIETFGDKYCVAGLGWAGAIERVTEDIHEQFKTLKPNSMRTFVDLCEDMVAKYVKKYGDRLNTTEEDFELALVCVSKDRISLVQEDGIAD